MIKDREPSGVMSMVYGKVSVAKDFSGKLIKNNITIEAATIAGVMVASQPSMSFLETTSICFAAGFQVIGEVVISSPNDLISSMQNFGWCLRHLNKFSHIDRARFDAEQGFSSNSWMIGMRSREIAKKLESDGHFK